MNREHLTDKQLQDFADGVSSPVDAVGKHLSSCAQCQISLENYRMLNAVLKDIPAASFRFDLAELMPADVTQKQKGNPPMVVPIAAGLGLALIIFSQAIYGKHLLALFDIFSEIQLYLLSTPIVALAITQATIYFVRHRRKVELLVTKTEIIAA